MEAMSQVELKFSARKLKNMDGVFNKSDPIVQVYFQKDNGKREFVGQTERIDNNLNPDWVTGITVDYFFEEQQMVVCRVLDVDNDKVTFKDADFIGECLFPLGKLVASKGQKLRFALKLPGTKMHGPRGDLSIHGEVSDVSNDIAKFKFELFDLPKKSALCGFGSRAPKPAVVVRRVREDGEWVKVLETETAPRGTQARFNRQQEHVSKLSNGDLDRPVRVEVVDKSRGNDCPPVIASLDTTLRAMEEQKGLPMQLREALDMGSKSSATIACNCIVEHQPTFMDYVRGGLQLNLHVAIDFTASNGDPMDNNSLHCMLNPNQSNQYEAVITSVCSILENYDSDKMYPVHGFGAKPGNGRPVSHRFSCDPNGQEVYGLKGILNAYRDAVQRVNFSGPTLFAPMINGLVNEVQQELRQNPNDFSYNIQLILTDGDIHDMGTTIDAIVKSSELPISIIIVGIGNEEFQKMEALDADSVRLVSSSGKSQFHDNVQFVPFHECANNGARLAREVLKELPDQVVTHFYQGRRMNAPAPLAASEGRNSVASSGTGGFPTLHSQMSFNQPSSNPGYQHPGSPYSTKTDLKPHFEMPVSSNCSSRSTASSAGNHVQQGPVVVACPVALPVGEVVAPSDPFVAPKPWHHEYVPKL